MSLPPRLRHRACLLAALLCLSGPLAADGLQEASQLFRQGKNAQALAKIDAYVAANPKDAQGRFLKGLILTELNRHSEAIRVFTELTTDFPQLPEPYNNLAVLYAAQGQYERAKQYLEQAIRTHPSYATAHENLGDVYAKLASIAYDKALQLDESNVSAQTKLALIRELFAPARGAEAARPRAKTTAARTAGSGKAPAEPEPPAANPAGESRPLEPASEPQAAREPAATAAPAKGAAPTQVQPASREAVEQTVRDWAAAWSRQDVAAYLAFYAPDFTPPRGQDRAAWEAERRQRLTAPSRIKVEVSDLRVDLKGEQAQVRFRQRYESDRLSGTYGKTLVLRRVDGQWKIVQER
ncbi:MAG: tetratricopeptide repeat protein [Burkholderiales bacterium]|nr:tetratricopeptide repeat protein [Burkholderiales bacterium]